ncbi:MAG: rhomboid family intramembrane serine protease [Deltaproteobacteria bacterium]|nr:rhomboid family intramembrane serine protease [Deltaproteobacteria bacterium]
MDGLKKLPIVSALIALAMIAAPILLGGDHRPAAAQFDAAREGAREYLMRHPQLEVDAIGRLILDPEWLADALADAADSGSSSSVELPTRMLARSQAKFDSLIDAAYEARLRADPGWRFGVRATGRPPINHFAHAFVHENTVGVLLCLTVLLLVGIPLERTWGSAIFMVFAVLAIPLSAQGYRLFDASSGVPWTGGAGLAAALLGAYFVRGLGGHFLLPGWVLLPTWLAVESFVVRNLWLDDLGSVPWTSLCASVGFGALAAGGLRLFGVDSKLASRESSKASRGPNPVVARASRLRSDGDPQQAFDLIQAAWRESPKDAEIVEAYFSIAVEVGQLETVAELILPSLRSALRAGDLPRALEFWLPIATAECDVRLESTASVRLGEALLDAGHPEQALFSLRGALHAGVSAAHAMRIVKIARDLDESLAREAATIALTDRTLDAAHRAELEAMTERPTDPSPPDMTRKEATEELPEAPKSQPDQPTQAEHHPSETTAFPLEADSALEASDADASGPSDANEARLAEQDLDPSALSLEGLEAETGGSQADLSIGEIDSGDVLSHWNDPSDIGDLNSALGSDLLSAGDLDFFDDCFEPSDAGGGGLMDPAEAETDTDMTPLIDASDELTSTLEAPADQMTVWGPTAEQAGLEASGANDDDTRLFSPEPSPVSPAIVPDPAETVVASSADDDEFSVGIDQSPASPPPLRVLKALDSVPVGVGEDSIEIDVEGRGKSHLPIVRIQAICMAAVSGLASRPVLIVDFALNWSSDQSEPLKVIRLRSDRFDPCLFEPGEVNPLQALMVWVRNVQIRSGATCLPSRTMLEGQFARFDSLEAYESEVLMASR